MVLKEGLCRISTYHGSMTTTEFIPVSERTYKAISDLKGPDKTFDEIIADLVEHAKKQQLEDDVEAVLARKRFVEL